MLLEGVMGLYGAESFPRDIDKVCHDNVDLYCISSKSSIIWLGARHIIQRGYGVTVTGFLVLPIYY